MNGWTPRRQVVRDLILDGKSQREIADSLGVALGTARAHIEFVLQLEGCHSMRELLARELKRLREIAT